MNWFFEPLGDFFQWTFKGYEWLMNHHFNIVLIAVGALMILYWFMQMIRHPKED